MSDLTTYANQIAVVKQECPDANDEEIGKEFQRYESDFLIPPEDALRSVIRKFQAATGVEMTSESATQVREEKKVQRFSELGSDDRNVSVEVAVISYTPRTQMVRGRRSRLHSDGSRITLGKLAPRGSGGITKTGEIREKQWFPVRC